MHTYHCNHLSLKTHRIHILTQMGTFTSRIIIASMLVLLGVTTCSATRSLLFPYPYEGSHGGYGSGYGGLGGGYGGYGGYGGGPYGGPFFPGFGGGYGGGYGGGKGVADERVQKGPDGLAEGLGFGVRGHEEKGGVEEGIGYNHEGGEKGSQFGGPGFGGGCGRKSEVVKPGITP